MVSTQILKNSLEELKNISRIEFCLHEASGRLIVRTEGMDVPDTDIIRTFAQSGADSQIIGTNYFLKVLDEGEIAYVLTAAGSADYCFMAARMAVSQLQQLIQAYKEKYDRNTFFQNLMLDNLLLVDILSRSRKLHVENQHPRIVILMELESGKDALAGQILAGLFSVQNGDYLTVVDENSIILIKSLKSADSYEEAADAAALAVDILNTEGMMRVRAAYGTIVDELKDLSKSYKEAKMAMDVGKIFYAERYVISYRELGIGRLIYQLPVNLCEMFIAEIFSENPGEYLDQETLSTITTFFENDLNVSETARKLFVHRNTLVYRIEKLEKETGLDIRKFDDALTLDIALMVVRYMNYLKNRI